MSRRARFLSVMSLLAIAASANAADARPEVCPAVYPHPCAYTPTERGAFSASGEWEVIVIEGDDMTRITGATELGEIVSQGGLPKADLIAVRGLSPGSWIIAGSTDCSECP